jgi:hypothetical protein
MNEMNKQTVLELKQEGRRGTITLSREIIEDTDIHTMSIFMSKIIVMRAYWENYGDNLTYECLSPFFREAEEGEMTPKYMIEVSRIFKGLTSDFALSFVEVEVEVNE